METYVILTEDGTILNDSPYIGALRKPIMSAVREMLKDGKEVKITVLNADTFTDFIIRKA